MLVRNKKERRERARERVRREILLSAASVFAEHGFANATLSDLARASGYAAPSLYRYFSGKEEIFQKLIQLLTSEFCATFEQPVDRGRPLAHRLQELITAQGRLVKARGTIFEVMHAAAAADAPPAHPGGPARASSPGLVAYAEWIEGWLRKNAIEGELRCPVEVAARAVAGIAIGFYTCGRGSDLAPEAFAQYVVDLALNGVAPSTPAAGLEACAGESA